MNEKARGHSQPWDASDRGGLGSIFITEKWRRAHQACANKRKQTKVGKRLENYRNMVHTTCNRE